MKIIKLLFIFAVVSMIAVSCKETKKEEVQDDSMEMTDEGSDASADDAATMGATGGGAEATSEEGEAMEAATSIEGESKDVEAIPVPEGVISEDLADTPVVYPGCEGTVEEIRACNRKSYTEFIMNSFDNEIAKESNLEAGEYKINTVFHVDKTGKISALRITAPNQSLETEMKRITAKVPQVTPATKGGEPVGVTFMLPITFEVK